MTIGLISYVWFGVCEVSEVRSLALAERSCSGSSLDSGKMLIGDDNSTCHADDTTPPCQLQHADEIVRSKACRSDAVADDVVADDDDIDRPRDSRPRDSDVIMVGGAFPVKPPPQTVAASCPTSPSSDVVRTSAEGCRTCDDGQEQNESHDNVTSSP